MAGAGDRLARRPRPHPPARARPVPNEVYKVAVGDAATKGGKQPKVTIVEFSEFQCPFCSRAQPIIKQILDDLQGRRADRVQAPAAAHAQQRRDRGAGGRGGPRAGQVLGDARQDVRQPAGAGPAQPGEVRPGEWASTWAKFKAALDSSKHKAQLEADKAQAAQFGVTGTPTFFVNGRKIVGAQPVRRVQDASSTRRSPRLTRS